MYVCVCNAVTEKQIFNAVKNGAKTVKDLKETLGVASECISCVDCAKACIKEAHAECHQSKARFVPIVQQNMAFAA